VFENRRLIFGFWGKCLKRGGLLVGRGRDGGRFRLYRKGRFDGFGGSHFRDGAGGLLGRGADQSVRGAGGDLDGVAEPDVRIGVPPGLWFCFLGGRGSRRGIDGEGETVFVVGDFVDAIGGMDVELQIMLLVEGLEAGLHERVRALSWRWSMWP
jgi:hypothetical protein